MKYLFALLLTVASAHAQAVWGNATFIVPTNWAALYGFVTNATGYPLLAWYQADNYVTNAGVATLPDSWTNAWHLTNVTTAAFPTSVAADLGGHTTIQFDGVNDYLNTVLYTNVQPSEVWLVMMENGSTGTSGAWSYECGLYGSQPTGIGYSRIDGLFNIYASAYLYSSFTSNAWNAVTATYATTASQISMNGLVMTNGSVGIKYRQGLLVGRYNTANYVAKFKLAELIAFGNGSATPGTNTVARSNIWYYVKSKYGLR